MRKGEPQARDPASHEEIEVIERRSPDSDPHFPGAEFRALDSADLDHVGTAELPEQCGSHVGTIRPAAGTCEQAVT
jgi:hypothetical protein